jgi:hypothetical protein
MTESFVVFSGTPGKWWDITLNYATADSYNIASNQLFTNKPMLQNMGYRKFR